MKREKKTREKTRRNIKPKENRAELEADKGELKGEGLFRYTEREEIVLEQM